MVSRAIAIAADQGQVVIVGRAGNHVLPPSSGLRVRVMAPREVRRAALAQREALDIEDADRLLDKLDTNRKSFVRRHFHCDSTDPRHYDLVLDSAKFGIEGASDIICRALEVRGLSG